MTQQKPDENTVVLASMGGLITGVGVALLIGGIADRIGANFGEMSGAAILAGLFCGAVVFAICNRPGASP